MKRRAFIQSLVAGSAASGALARKGVSASAGDRPNFLFMIADDLTYVGEGGK